MKITRSLSLLWILCSITYTAYSEIPAGYYYLADGKSKAELKTALHNIIKQGKFLEYGSGEGHTWEGFFRTDRRDDGSVWDMYSSEVRHFDGYSSIKGMHIEHSFPKSWWGAYENYAYRDLFHLYPADGSANSSKNNFPLGEMAGTPGFDNGVSQTGKNGFGDYYSGTAFEPADEYKGDFARSYFYVVTAYEEMADLWQSPMLDNNTYPVWKKWAIDLLLKWHRQDPVSPKERDRIEAVYNIQGNRNPFIDYPDLAEYIWGKDTLSVYHFPEETEPFLASPAKGTRIDMGATVQQYPLKTDIWIQGANLTENVTVGWQNGNAGLSASQNTISKEDAISGCNLEIRFSAMNVEVARDTLLLMDGGLSDTLKVPVTAVAVSGFRLLESSNTSATGGTLNWVNYPSVTDYRLSLYQGDIAAGNLIISAYIEGSSYNKAIEIYNGTGRDVDLSAYSLRKQNNGRGDFGDDCPLKGILAAGKSFLVVNTQCSTELSALASQKVGGEYSVMNFNGNDAVALCWEGMMIDMVGIPDMQQDWGKDVSLYRKSNVTHPALDFNWEEWSVSDIDDILGLGKHIMELQSEQHPLWTNVSAGTGVSYTVKGLKPGTTYTCRAEAVTANSSIPASNTVQLRTQELEAPQILEPSDVAGTSFTANWEEVAEAGSYQLNLYTIIPGETIKNTQPFDEIGASGKPLPEGWTGTVSGRYTAEASSGKAIPSVSFQNMDEWLQTCNYPGVVTSLSFMYRFPSSGAGSYFTVEQLTSGGWMPLDTIEYENTKKQIATYDNIPADREVSAFKFTYKKTKGNLAIDDVEVSYIRSDISYVHKDIPANGTSYRFTGLQSKTAYYYQVRSVWGENIFSVWTSPMKATTEEASGVEVLHGKSPVKILNYMNELYISGLSGNETISVYTLSGSCISRVNVRTQIYKLPLPVSGIYIIQIKNTDKTYNFKVIK